MAISNPSHNGDDHDGGVSRAQRGDGDDSDGDGALHACALELGCRRPRRLLPACQLAMALLALA